MIVLKIITLAVISRKDYVQKAGWGDQPCQNVLSASNFAAFSPFHAAYSILDFTRSPLAGKGTWCLLPTTPSMLPTCY